MGSKSDQTVVLRFLPAWILFLLASFASEARCDSYKPVDHLWMGLRDFPNSESLIVMGSGAALALTSFFFVDESVHKYFAGQNRLGSSERVGNDYLGTGIPGAGLAVSMLGYGLWSSRADYVDSGEAQLEALAATFVFTDLLKFTTRRSRPESANRLSFPSGHTSTVFASAASLMDTKGEAWGIPTLVLGAFTGLCRLDVNAHYLSDVLFGAALGYALGHSYALHHVEIGNAKSVSISPYFDDRSNFGIYLSFNGKIAGNPVGHASADNP